MQVFMDSAGVRYILYPGTVESTDFTATGRVSVKYVTGEYDLFQPYVNL